MFTNHNRLSLSISDAMIMVYVLERNHLAAEYLRKLLSTDSSISLEIIHGLSGMNHVFTREKCVLIVNEAEVTYPLGAYIRILKTFLPEARLLFIGSQEFEARLQSCTEGTHSFVEYVDLCENLVPSVKGVFHTEAPNHNLATMPSLPSYVPQQQLPGSITKREQEILGLILRRLSNKEIGSILNIAEATVKFHVSNIFSKINVNRRRELLLRFSQSDSLRIAL
ncbi:MAG TPA: LuxR C-terminal-related transcriptional regulator [Candidatus Angelobacter sp.]|nr:LuxR C-terminal-related transcriptional regulator [Candidatus Angelobacter sp.]